MTEEIKNNLYTDSLIYAVKQTEKFTKMLCMQLFAKLDASVSPEELVVLEVAHNNPDICQRDLAKLLIKDRANTGRLLESLEKKKLIERIVDVKNNRLVKKMVLTPAGESILEELLEKVIPVFDKVYENFSREEMIAAKNSLAKMRHTLQDIVESQI